MASPLEMTTQVKGGKELLETVIGNRLVSATVAQLGGLEISVTNMTMWLVGVFEQPADVPSIFLTDASTNYVHVTSANPDVVTVTTVPPTGDFVLLSVIVTAGGVVTQQTDPIIAPGSDTVAEAILTGNFIHVFNQEQFDTHYTDVNTPKALILHPKATPYDLPSNALLSAVTMVALSKTSPVTIQGAIPANPLTFGAGELTLKSLLVGSGMTVSGGGVYLDSCSSGLSGVMDFVGGVSIINDCAFLGVFNITGATALVRVQGASTFQSLGNTISAGSLFLDQTTMLNTLGVGPYWDVTGSTATFGCRDVRILGGIPAQGIIRCSAGICMADGVSYLGAGTTNPMFVQSGSGVLEVGHYNRGLSTGEFTGNIKPFFENSASRLFTNFEQSPKIDGTVVQTNDNGEIGTWSNLTAAIAVEDGVTAALFPGTGSGNVLYMGADEQFAAIEMVITVAAVLGAGVIIPEIWNGVSWSRANLMIADREAPHDQYGLDGLTRVGSEIIRIDPPVTWVAKALDGITKFWLRFRINTAITTVPEGDFIRTHKSKVLISNNGVPQYIGTSLFKRELPFHVGFLQTDFPGFPMGNHTITYAITAGVDGLFNTFVDTQFDITGRNFFVPEGLNTATPLELIVNWSVDADVAAGDVEFELSYLVSTLSDILDGTGSTSDLADITTVPLNSANSKFQTVFPITIRGAIPGDILALSLWRDATVGNVDDTLASNVYLEAVQLVGSFWR